MDTWFYRLPKAARFVIYTAISFGVVGVVALGFTGVHTESLVRTLVQVAVIAVAVAAACTIFGERRLRRDFGSIEQFVDYSRALRTGELPARIEPDAWRGWLNRSRRQDRLLAVFACLLLVAWLLRILAHPSEASQWGIWITTSLYALLAIGSMVSWQLRRGRISRLAAAVEQRAAETPID